MKKLVALMLCCMMMVGALSAFAAESITPRIDCNHTYGTTTELVKTSRVGTCYYKDVYREICDDCGSTVDEYADYYTSHDGPIREVNGVDVCMSCGDEA